MKQIKRFLGLIWMIIGPAIIVALFWSAFKNIDINGKTDINNPIPWTIILTIFTPIAVGLIIFGWYVWNGEYENVETEPG